ncbi:MAG TPA: alpha/beta fold hydrolase, partial [Polyangiaceae bacterium]|nr:alpha/beta fold hydrolase [Polyangiaceae bacterium]
GSIFEFAQAAARALEPLLDVPFAVFGYSLGALMAFEWLRVVRRKQGREATHLVTAACAAPHLQRRLSPISGEPDPIFVRELELRYGPFDAVIKGDPALFEVIVKIMRRDMAMLESYHYQNDEPFACPLLALGGAADPSVLPDELQAWCAQTQAKFAQRHFPGGHFFLRSSGQALRETILEHILSMKRSTEPAPPVFS